MKNFYQWGTNPYYYLAGKYGIHPTYIQEMISQKISDAEIIKMINLLKENNKNKYEINLVISEFQKPIKITKGKWSPVKKLKNQEVLLIGSGEKTTKYREIIENYIKIKKPIVIALKINTVINPSLINYYISCNPLRIVNEIKKLKNLKKLIIIPKTLIKGKIKFSHSQKKILDFGIGIKDNKFKFFKNCAYLDKLYTISYALAVATSGKASKISLAGFDGYGEKDIRTKNITQVFTNYINHKNSLPLKFITPSSYNFNISRNAI
jgi:4-hydroxy 2-oxovalerate aldolase